MIRITSQGMTARLMHHLQTTQARLAETQDRMGSGKRILRPSDDPFGNSHAMAMHADLSLIGQRQRNIELAKSELAVTESSLDGLGRVISRAQELAVQADSSALDGAGRLAIAAEVDRLIQEAATIGNTSYSGRRIFGGYQSTTQPFTPDLPANATAVVYAGDAGVITRAIGTGENLEVNLDGQALFGGVFTSLIAFRDALGANDRPAMSAASAALGNDADRALQARGEIGARMRRVDLASERLEGDVVRLQTQIAEVEDADLTKEAVDLQMRDVAMQAALSATAKSLTTSLLEFLR
jgi:flagellar hook-associated protein 3 FlgL